MYYLHICARALGYILFNGCIHLLLKLIIPVKQQYKIKMFIHIYKHIVIKAQVVIKMNS